MNNLQDKFLVYRLKKLNDPEVFGEVYDDYVDKIYRFIFFKVREKQEAEDLTSEVFLKLWQSIRSEENIVNLKSYLYKIARNSVIDYYRKRAGQAEVLTADEHYQNENLAAEIDSIRRVDNETELKIILETVNRLKDEYKEVILLKYVEGLSTQEISSVIDKSRGATRVLIHRAINTLKEILASEGKINYD